MVEKIPLGGARSKMRLSVPPFAWHIVDLVMTVALTAAVTLVIMVANGLLAAKGAAPARPGPLGAYEQGFDTWLGFIARPDILGTMIVTALVATIYFSWRNRDKK